MPATTNAAASGSIGYDISANSMAKKKAMDALLESYSAGKLSSEEYMAQRNKLLTPGQNEKLNVLLNGYADGKMTGSEYMAAREKILLEAN